MDGITFDDALIKHVGQFGPGQWRILAASSVCLIANAAAFFYMVFAAVNPVAQHDWRCLDPSDAACQAVWQQDRPSSQDFCALPAGSTQWTSTGMQMMLAALGSLQPLPLTAVTTWLKTLQGV
jgi:hypothetical protein